MRITEYESHVPIRWSDQDANGHVNNATIVTLIEESRIEWLNRDSAVQGLGLFIGPKIVVSLKVDYTNSVTTSSALRVFVSTEKVGRTSFTLRYRGVQNGIVAFRARTVLVTVDPQTQRPRLITADERSYLEQRLMPLD